MTTCDNCEVRLRATDIKTSIMPNENHPSGYVQFEFCPACYQEAAQIMSQALVDWVKKGKES